METGLHIFVASATTRGFLAAALALVCMPGNSCWFGFRYPDGWKDTIVAFAESDRSSYKKIYAARPDHARAVRLMHEYTENCKAEHCVADREYLEACGMKVPKAGVSSVGAGSKKGQLFGTS